MSILDEFPSHGRDHFFHVSPYRELIIFEIIVLIKVFREIGLVAVFGIPPPLDRNNANEFCFSK